jgi:hypothetical protein
LRIISNKRIIRNKRIMLFMPQQESRRIRMRRTKRPTHEGWTNTGVRVNQARWIELKKVALDQKRTASEVLDDAIALDRESDKVAVQEREGDQRTGAGRS